MWPAGPPGEMPRAYTPEHDRGLCLFTLFICVGACMFNTQHLKVRGQLTGVIFSFKGVDLEDRAQVLRLDGCHLYLILLARGRRTFSRVTIARGLKH